MWRNPNRTVVTMSSIFFAVILSVLASSLKTGIFDNLVKNVVSFYTGYVQVHKQGYWDEQILDNSFNASLESEHKILKNKNIITVTPRLESFALVSSTDITKGSLVVGIDPEKENQITFLKKKLTSGSYINANENALLIAEGLAERMKLKTGDIAVLMGQGYHGNTAAGKYPIKGIVKFGSPELNDKTLYMPLQTAQELYSAPGMITSYILSLYDTKELGSTVSSLRNQLGPSFEVMAWSEMLPEIKQHIETDSNNMKYVQGILYLLICFGIFGTLLMLMVERKFEMGMLVAIGMKKTKLIFLMMLESVFTVFSGCLFGILCSIPLVFYLNKHPLKMGGDTAKAYERFGFEPIFPTSTDASSFISQGLTVLIIGLLLSLYTVYKIIKMNPLASMRE